jgi:hypothetical protein
MNAAQMRRLEADAAAAELHLTTDSEKYLRALLAQRQQHGRTTPAEDALIALNQAHDAGASEEVLAALTLAVAEALAGPV